MKREIIKYDGEKPDLFLSMSSSPIITHNHPEQTHIGTRDQLNTRLVSLKGCVAFFKSCKQSYDYNSSKSRGWTISNRALVASVIAEDEERIRQLSEKLSIERNDLNNKEITQPLFYPKF